MVGKNFKERPKGKGEKRGKEEGKGGIEGGEAEALVYKTSYWRQKWQEENKPTELSGEDNNSSNGREFAEAT